MKKFLIAALVSLAATPALAMGDKEPLVAALQVNEWELQRQSGENPHAWDIEFSIGRDLHRFHLVSEGAADKGGLEEHELRAYYSYAIDPNWNLFAGWRGDLHPNPKRNWLAVGFEGDAPFEIETEVTLFLGNNGRSGLRLDLEKAFMLTQNLALIPEVNFEFHGHNDEAVGTGSGLSVLEAAVRLAYEITPRFAPYIGVGWEKHYGKTARFAREEGEGTEGGFFILGVSFWF